MQTLWPRDMFGGHLPSVRIKTWRQEMESSTSLATDFKSSALNSQMSWLENGLSPNSNWWSLIIVILVLNMVHHEIVEGIVWFHVSWVFAGILGDTMWYSTYDDFRVCLHVSKDLMRLGETSAIQLRFTSEFLAPAIIFGQSRSWDLLEGHDCRVLLDIT